MHNGVGYSVLEEGVICLILMASGNGSRGGVPTMIHCFVNAKSAKKSVD